MIGMLFLRMKSKNTKGTRYGLAKRNVKVYRQIVGISMGTNCAPLLADLFLFRYERDFMECFFFL